MAIRPGSRQTLHEIASTRLSRNPASGDQQHDDLAKGRFSLLSVEQTLGRPIDWRGVASPSRLWGFQLQYQEYLLDLAAGLTHEDANSWRLIWETVGSWIAGHPPELAHHGDAWHPYCISRRLPVWAQLWALSPAPPEGESEFLQNLAQQAQWLSASLEFDLGGNHLLENLRALALAGCWLEGPTTQQWLDLAERHLRSELARQILPTGEHYERAPMYHCQVLGNLLQVGIAARNVQPTLAELCFTTATQMSEFLEQILHPDDEIPLWGDSCLGEAFSVAEIRALQGVAGMRGPSAPPPGANVTGTTWTWRDENDVLLLDAGPVGAETLPAHAHCDLLGFEASIAGQRWLVDSGLFDYDESSMRNYCRSSVAHNVVTVDNQNCCDVWSRFRMGRRGRVTHFDHGQQADLAWCRASHDGYRPHGVPELARLVVAGPGLGFGCVETAFPSAEVLQSARVVGRLHLAPELVVETDGPQRVKLSRGSTQRWLLFPEGTSYGFAQGWYCDRFGRRARTQVINYQPTGTCDRPFGWWLTPHDDSAFALVEGRGRFSLEAATFEFPLSRA